MFDSSTRWAAPIFFMISGALLLNPLNNSSLVDFYSTRARKVGMPFLFWLICFSLLVMYQQNLNMEQVLVKIFNGQIYYHLWFIYAIIGLYMITPFIKYFIISKLRPSQVLHLSFLLFFIFIVYSFYKKFIHYHQTPGFLLFLPYISYYIAGYCFSAMGLNRRFSTKTLITMILLSFIGTNIGLGWVTLRMGNIFYGRYFYSNFSPFVIITALSIFLLWQKNRTRFHCQRDSNHEIFGVYIIHPLIISACYYYIPKDLLLFSIPIASLIVFLTSYMLVIFYSELPYIKRIFK